MTSSKPLESPDPLLSERPEAYSVVLMEFETQDNYGRHIPLDREAVREVRMRMQRVLEGKEAIVFYGERELLVFMPGVSSEMLAGRVRVLRDTFHQWRADRAQEHGNTRINLGFSVCEGEEDLSRTLEVASVVMHPETDESE